MTDEPTMKLTDFDYLTGDHHLQMLKAALPYVNVPEQRFLSILVKFQELQRTISLFEEEETAALGICSLGEEVPRSPVAMLEAMKPYGTTQEQDFLDLVSNFIQGFRLGNYYQQIHSQEVSSQSPFDHPSTFQKNSQDIKHPSPTQSSQTTPLEQTISTGTQETADSRSRFSQLEQLKPFLPKEQQDRLETMSMLMQTMQQFT